MKKAAIIGFGLCALGVAIAPLSAHQFSIISLAGDPPVADAQALAGLWKVDTTSGSEFFLTLNVAGDVVSGNFQVPGQPQYNGTFSGVVTNSDIRFSWSQLHAPGPGGNTWGYGVLRVFTNNTFRADLVYGAQVEVERNMPVVPQFGWTGVKQTIHHTGKPRPSGGPADGGNGPQATAVQATTVYKTHSGSSSASNKVCGMRPGDAGTVVSKGPDQWVDLANISGLSCAGQSGWVWNAGTLKLP
jgi:hypothetical protein